ncbi:MAG: hypothetical protein ACXVEE_42095 [Polyangiales bacterium]
MATTVSPLLVEPVGTEFDVRTVASYLRAMPHTVQDRFTPDVFLVGEDEGDIDFAIEHRERDSERFPYNVLLVTVGPTRIDITSLGTPPEPVRQFVEWLRRRYPLRLMQEDFTDVTARCATDLDYVFGPPPELPFVPSYPRIEATPDLRSATFPIGCTLDDGAFQIVEELRGTPDRGIYRARENWSNRSVLVTLGPPQTIDVAAKLVGRARGVAHVRFIGRLETTGEAQYTGLVEDEPEGTPASLSLQLPVDTARSVKLAFGLADIASDAGVPLVGLRPELVYLRGDEITGVAPRGEQFLVTAETRCYGVPPCFDHYYLAPEVLARPREPATEYADVFSICAMLGHWIDGEHPFEGRGAEQAISIAINRRRPSRDLGMPALRELIDAGLSPSPDDRPLLVELLQALDAFRRASS